MNMPAHLLLLVCGFVFVAAPAYTQDAPRRPVEPPAASTAPEARRGMGMGRGLIEPARPLAAPMQGWMQDSVQRSVELGSSGIFILKNTAGEVRVTGTDGNTVRLTAYRRVREQNKDTGRAMLQDIVIRVTERGGGVEVFTENSNPRGTLTLIDYEIALPSAAKITIQNTGTVRIQNVKGEVRAEAFAGNIALFNVGRVRQAKAYGSMGPGGNIVITNAEGEEVAAETTFNGAMQLRNVRARNIELRAINGNISATNVDCEECEFQTLLGEIEFVGALRRGGRYDFATNTGNIRMLIDGNVGFDLEAVSSNIRVPDFQLKQTAPSPAGGRSLLGSYGDGSAILSLRTFKGSITLSKGGPAR
jgi:hypothetical protein